MIFMVEWWFGREVKCVERREKNGEKEDEDEMESEGMSKVKWEMSFYVY